MPLSWNEIPHRAITFSRERKDFSSEQGERKDSSSEQGERQTFWNEFFEVFGKQCKHLAPFEEPVKELSGIWGHIDLFWPGKCIVEHKSLNSDAKRIGNYWDFPCGTLFRLTLYSPIASQNWHSFDRTETFIH